MNKYRPDEWERIKRTNCDCGDCVTCPAEPMTCDTKGEALVDAMLEGLRKASRMSVETGQVYTTDKGAYQWHQFKANGYLAFIPDEEVDGNTGK